MLTQLGPNRGWGLTAQRAPWTRRNDAGEILAKDAPSQHILGHGCLDSVNIMGNSWKNSPRLERWSAIKGSTGRWWKFKSQTRPIDRCPHPKVDVNYCTLVHFWDVQRGYYTTYDKLWLWPTTMMFQSIPTEMKIPRVETSDSVLVSGHLKVLLLRGVLLWYRWDYGKNCKNHDQKMRPKPLPALLEDERKRNQTAALMSTSWAPAGPGIGPLESVWISEPQYPTKNEWEIMKHIMRTMRTPSVTFLLDFARVDLLYSVCQSCHKGSPLAASRSKQSSYLLL